MTVRETIQKVFGRKGPTEHDLDIDQARRACAEAEAHYERSVDYSAAISREADVAREVLRRNHIGPGLAAAWSRKS